MSTAAPRLDLAEVLLSLGACSPKPDDAVPWSRPYGGDWERALAECPHRDWIFWLAGALMRRSHLKREVLVLCACACARTALEHVPAGEERPRLAIETAERWTRGEATLDEVRAAREGATAAASGDDAAVCAAAATAAAAAAAYSDAYDVARAARAAAWAAADAAYSEACDASARLRAETDLLAITKRELGPALIEGLTAYASAMQEPSR